MVSLEYGVRFGVWPCEVFLLQETMVLQLLTQTVLHNLNTPARGKYNKINQEFFWNPWKGCCLFITTCAQTKPALASMFSVHSQNIFFFYLIWIRLGWIFRQTHASIEESFVHTKSHIIIQLLVILGWKWMINYSVISKWLWLQCTESGGLIKPTKQLLYDLQDQVSCTLFSMNTRTLSLSSIPPFSLEYYLLSPAACLTLTNHFPRRDILITAPPMSSAGRRPLMWTQPSAATAVHLLETMWRHV